MRLDHVRTKKPERGTQRSNVSVQKEQPRPDRRQVKFTTCPNRWCNDGSYYESTNDAGRTTGYCQTCSFEK